MSSEENTAKIEAGFAFVNERNIDGFLSLLEPEFKLNLIMKPDMLQQAHGTLQGPDGFRYYLNLLYTAFPDYLMQQVSIRAHGNMVYQEIVIRGNHLGDFVLPNGIKIPPTRMKIEIPVEVYHTFDADGRFLSSTGYANLIDVVKQFKL